MSKKIYEAPACKEQEILKITVEGLEDTIKTARSNKVAQLLKAQDELQKIRKYD